jgi:hypothetical protein
MHASECIHAAAMGFGWKHSLCRRRIKVWLLYPFLGPFSAPFAFGSGCFLLSICVEVTFNHFEINTLKDFEK